MNLLSFQGGYCRHYLLVSELRLDFFHDTPESICQGTQAIDPLVVAMVRSAVAWCLVLERKGPRSCAHFTHLLPFHASGPPFHLSDCFSL